MDSAELTTTIDMAMLELAPDESDTVQRSVSQMLDYFAVMAAAPVDGVEPTTHAFSTTNRTRPDTRNERSVADELLESAPDLEDRFIAIPNVL